MAAVTALKSYNGCVGYIIVTFVEICNRKTFLHNKNGAQSEKGILVNFISYPVISAFTSAAAITIAIGQIKTLLGLKNIPNDFLPMIYETCKKMPQTKIRDMTMGLSSFVVLVLMKKLREIKFKKDPDQPLATWKRVLMKTFWLISISANVVVVTITSDIVTILESHGLKNAISVTGKIKAGMPDFTPPKFEINKGNITMSSTEAC